MYFEVSKTKEILVYLVDRCGSMCENREIIAALWEDEYNHDSYETMFLMRFLHALTD